MVCASAILLGGGCLPRIWHYCPLLSPGLRVVARSCTYPLHCFQGMAECRLIVLSKATALRVVACRGCTHFFLTGDGKWPMCSSPFQGALTESGPLTIWLAIYGDPSLEPPPGIIDCNQFPHSWVGKTWVGKLLGCHTGSGIPSFIL